ncbi:ESPR domain-containing protein [Burkholderia pseudomallei]|uniref:ESPR domain-containing protein n=1 Tax=Burkholderia pseudomallei TaxID=28450 RepID=UPI003F5B944F
MNKIYRKVWNKARGQLVVASELASSRSSVGEASVDAGRSGDQTGSAAFTSEERNPGSGRMIPLAIMPACTAPGAIIWVAFSACRALPKRSAMSPTPAMARRAAATRRRSA